MRRYVCLVLVAAIGVLMAVSHGSAGPFEPLFRIVEISGTCSVRAPGAERFDDAESIGRNVRQEVMSPTGILRIEPFFLLADEVREPRNYAAGLRAIGEGHHTLDAITLVKVQGIVAGVKPLIPQNRFEAVARDDMVREDLISVLGAYGRLVKSKPPSTTISL